MSDVKLRECPVLSMANTISADNEIELADQAIHGIRANCITCPNRKPSAVEQELREAVELLEFYEGCNEKPPAHKPNKRPWVEINYEDFMTALTKLRAALLAKGA